MNKALARPNVDFYQKQNNKTPHKVDRYEQWLKQEDERLLGFLEAQAEEAGRRKAQGLPFKRPNLKGFEKRYFEENLTSYEELQRRSDKENTERTELIEYYLANAKDQAEFDGIVATL
jgi:hypothetical protein